MGSRNYVLSPAFCIEIRSNPTGAWQTQHIVA